MASSADATKRLLHDQITAMQHKIQLLEDDRTAHYECSQSTLLKNRETIRQLRQENEALRSNVAEANSCHENIIEAAFENRGAEKHAYRNMSVEAALTTLDQNVLSKMKRLNALKHTNDTYKCRLEALKAEYQRVTPEGSSGAQSADARTLKTKEDARNLRALENRLEKTEFKWKEAENIMIHYERVKSYLQEESLTFPGQLDSMEAEILKQREELHNMQLMKNNAQLVKESAKVNLQQQEELLYKERKERERILANYRKKVEECKIRAEKANRRVQRTIIQPDELSSEAQRSTPRMAGEEEKAISTFEEAFRHIKEATGVTDIQEIMKPFLSQKETRQHLDKLKGENEKVVQQLHEHKELLNQQFQDMKYSGEANLSRRDTQDTSYFVEKQVTNDAAVYSFTLNTLHYLCGFISEQQMLEEREQQLQAQQQRCDASKECLERLVKTLGTVRAGVEHLADKLQHIELSEDTVAVVSPDSDEYVLELMTQCELKLQLLHKEHQGKDVAAIRKEMEEEEFYIRIERKLPSYNTRVKLPEDQILDHFNDEDDSEGDEADILTREALKRQSQMIIDSKSKKKAWKKKGKL